MRICYLTSIHPDFDPRIWKYATSVADTGLEVHLVCPWNVPTGTILNGVTIHSFPRVENRALRPLLLPILISGRIFPILNQVDLVHFHDLDILPFMALLAKFKPVVYDVHENYADEMKEKDWLPVFLRSLAYHFIYHFENFLARMIKNVITVVPSQREKFRTLPLHLLEVKNYASMQLLKDANPDDYMTRLQKVIFSGANYESNGTLLLLEIAERLKNIRPNLTFLMVDRFASKKFRAQFFDEIQRRKLTSRVELVPRIPSDKLMTILNQGIIGLALNMRIPKQEKAIPTKLFEYMAASLPIVSSDLSYSRELFARQEFGLLAQPEDADSFAKAIIRLADDRELAMKMGQEGRKAFIKSYSWETQIPGLIEYYKRILTKTTKTTTWYK